MALWEKGDLAKDTAFMPELGEAVVRSFQKMTRLQVSDLGAAARRGGPTIIQGLRWAEPLRDSGADALVLVNNLFDAPGWDHARKSQGGCGRQDDADWFLVRFQKGRGV